MKTGYLHTNEKPQVGDKIKLEDNTSSSYYSSINLRLGSVYTVEAVQESSKSWTVKVDGDYSYFKASRFSLDERIGQSDTLSKFMILEGNRIVASAGNQGALEKALENLLRANPSKTYKVYVYSNSVRTETPRLNFFNERTKFSHNEEAETSTEWSPGLGTLFSKK